MGEWSYFSSRSTGKGRSIHKRENNFEQQIIFDENEFVNDVTDFIISPSHQIAMLIADVNGNDRFNIYIVTIPYDGEYIDIIENVSPVATWGSDDSCVYYIALDHRFREYQLWRRDITEKADVLLLEETDESFSLSVEKSLSNTYLFLNSEARNCTHTRYINLLAYDNVITDISPRIKNNMYKIVHHRNSFVFLWKNSEDESFKLISKSIELSEWKYSLDRLFQSNEHRIFENIFAFKKNIVILGRENFRQCAWVLETREKQGHIYVYDWRMIFREDKIYSINVRWDNKKYDTSTIRFDYSSFLIPYHVLEYNFVSHKTKILKKQNVPNVLVLTFQT